jgi:hypothetical protein
MPIPVRRHPRSSRILTGAALALILAGAPGRAAAQLPAPTPGGSPGQPNAVLTPASLQRIDTVEPSLGGVGSAVRVHAEYIDRLGKVMVGVGWVGEGYEVLGDAVQGRWGDVEASFEVPDSATWDRPLFVLLFNALFAPVAISPPFHVTDARGWIRRTGTVEEGADGCRMLLGEGEIRYALTGEARGVESGAAVVVEGPLGAGPASEGCPAAAAITVRRVEAAPEG